MPWARLTSQAEDCSRCHSAGIVTVKVGPKRQSVIFCQCITPSAHRGPNFRRECGLALDSAGHEAHSTDCTAFRVRPSPNQGASHDTTNLPDGGPRNP